MRIASMSRLSPPDLDVMNFLNEIVMRYPAAISFAPGRPAARFCDVGDSFAHLNRYVAELAAQQNVNQAQIRQQIGQYHKTNGIINDLISRFLSNDEQITVPPEALMVTNGAQEAMAILAIALFDPARDVLLVADPTYIGITGIAAILGVEMQPVPMTDDGLDIEELRERLCQIRARGKTPKAFYLIPDFSNPLGTSLKHEQRHQLLALALAHDLLIIEDNPYGMIAFDEPPAPTLKSLDSEGVVIYLGTFAKLLYPGLRIGFMIADQRVGAGPNGLYLAQELSKVKSLVSVNTAPLNQAIVGGILLEGDCSLRERLPDKIELYRTNRDQLLRALEQYFGGDPLLASRVTWNQPSGGIFLTLSLPFAFTPEHLTRCAEEYGVICCPMSFFSLAPGREHQIRLSFSAVSQAEIVAGVERLWQFVHHIVATTLGSHLLSQELLPCIETNRIA